MNEPDLIFIKTKVKNLSIQIRNLIETLNEKENEIKKLTSQNKDFKQKINELSDDNINTSSILNSSKLVKLSSPQIKKYIQTIDDCISYLQNH